MLTVQILVFVLWAALAGMLFALLVPGYLAWLWWGRRPRASAHPALAHAACPAVDVVVPVHDEVGLMAPKLADLAALTYPQDRTRIIVVDGASTDGTWEAVAARAAEDARLVPLRVDVADKTRQLNAGLARCHGDWVVVTDADASLPPDTLERLVATGATDPDVAVVGTVVTPAHAHALERLHWRTANLLRRHESDRGSASLVAAPCYAFRRTLLPAFPPDVVADDAHVALAAAAAGRRVVLADVRVIEQRSPLRLLDLFRHKLRKTDAYLREILRFLPRVGRMAHPARTIFLWRAAHLTILPVLVALAALGTTAGLTRTDLPAALHAVAALAAAGLFGASWWGLGRRANPALLLAHGLLLVAVTLAALLAYPFSRQTASFPKVGAPVRRGGA